MNSCSNFIQWSRPSCTSVALVVVVLVVAAMVDASVLIGSLDVGHPALDAISLSAPTAKNFLPKIVSRYDIVAVQGVSNDETAKEMLNFVNSQAANRTDMYNLAISGGSSMEQPIFFYRRSTVAVVHVWTYPNAGGTFDVPPFAVHVQPVLSDSVGVRDFLCISVRTSSNPVKNLAMLQEMTTVLQQAKQHWSGLGTPVPDLLVMGNLNADCDSFPAENWQKISLWTDRGKQYKWLLTRNADTTTTRATSCALDRFVASGDAMRKSVVASSAAVFRFDLAFALTYDETLLVSGHYPIEVRLQAADTVSQMPAQAGNPSLVIHTAPLGVTNRRDTKIWFDLTPIPAGFNPKKDTLSFICRYDDAPMASSCSSPWSMTMMEEGPHTLVIIPITSQGQNYSAASYTWTVDTRPPAVTAVRAAVDSDKQVIVSFNCDEGDCMYECLLHNSLLNPSNTFTPCWGGFRSSSLASSSSRMNMSVRAVDRAGNSGQAVFYSYNNSGDPNVNGGSSKNSTSNFLAGNNLIYISCGLTALGASMVWIVIMAMCRNSSSDDDNKSSVEAAAPYRAGGRAAEIDGAGGDVSGEAIALSPMHAVPAPRIQVHPGDVEAGTGVGSAGVGVASVGVGVASVGVGVGVGVSVLTAMQECRSTSSLRPRPLAGEHVNRADQQHAVAEQTTHFTRAPASVAEQTAHFTRAPVPTQRTADSRGSGDGQSLHGDGQSLRGENKLRSEGDLQSRMSILSHGIAYDPKRRGNCPSRSHRSNRCICNDKAEQIRLHNERKRERRRRHQYSRHHSSRLGCNSGALTDAEHYTYKPLVKSMELAGTLGYFPRRIITAGSHASMAEQTQPEDELDNVSRQAASVIEAYAAESSLGDADSASTAAAACAITDGSATAATGTAAVKPKLLDAKQRRKLAKRMMQERKAWTHYFSEINSDNESVCSSMRSAPVLPSGLRLLTMSIDARKDPDTQSIVSGVTTCV